MNNEWVEARKTETRKRFEEEKERIKKEISEFGRFFPGVEKTILENLDSLRYDDELLWYKLNDLEIDLRYGWRSTNLDYPDSYMEWFEKQLDYDRIKDCCVNYERYSDGELMEFDGSIIITDPCYIIRAEHHGTKSLTDDDWESCDYGSNMEALGIKKYMTRDTLYGDWSCTTFNTDTGEPIGEFCADAGLVSVFDLSEVLAYNPDFDYHIQRKWTTTLIENFKGTVQFVVKHVKGVHEDTTEWWNKGDEWEDYEVEVVGHGINKVTGDPINFVGRQTGF